MKAKADKVVVLHARPPVRNLAHLHRDRGYRFTDRDEVLTHLCEIITNSNLGAIAISQKTAKVFGTAITDATIYNWLSGRVKRPQNFTMDRVAYALGYERIGDKWRKLR